MLLAVVYKTSVFDILLMSLLIVIMSVIYIQRSKFIFLNSESKIRNVLLFSYWFHCVALLLNIIYHTYIYGGGDGFYIFRVANQIGDYLFKEPTTYFKLIFSNNLAFRMDKLHLQDTGYYIAENFFACRTTAIFYPLFFNNFWAASLFMMSLFFSVSLSIYPTMKKVFPELSNAFYYFLLFFPTTIFWSSGLSKEVIYFHLLLLMFNSILNIFYLKHRRVFHGIILIICLSIIFTIKSYIILSVLASLLLTKWIYYVFVIVKNRLLKIFWSIFSLGLSFLIFFISPLYNFIVDKVVNEILLQQIISNYQYLAINKKAGSSYDLGIKTGQVDFTQFLIVFPKSIFITLFRPFMWEIKSTAMILAALESTFLIIFSIYFIYKLGLRFLISATLKSQLLLFSLIFILSFAGIIGIASGNYGTLVRYKIPILPFYFFFFYYAYLLKSRSKDALIIGK